MEFELGDPLTSFQEHQSDTIPDLFASESDHMLSQEFLSGFKTSDFHVSFRREAISYILQVITTTVYIYVIDSETKIFSLYIVLCVILNLFYFTSAAFPQHGPVHTLPCYQLHESVHFKARHPGK